MHKSLQFSFGALTGAVGGLVLKSYPQYKRDLSAAYQRVQTKSQMTETAAGPINYAVAGAGPPVPVRCRLQYHRSYTGGICDQSHWFICRK